MSYISQIGDILKTFIEDLAIRIGLPEGVAKLIAEIFAWGVGAVWVLVFIMLAALVLIYLERKVSGYIQSRLGPTRCGPIGLLQTPADALKLLLKEDITPAEADRILHVMGPIGFFIVGVVAYAVIPWDEGATIAGRMDLSIGVLFVLSMSSLAVIGILMGGWGSNNKWSLLGAVRGAAQMVSYEVPLLLSVLCIVMQAETMSLNGIVGTQEGGILAWNFWRPWMWLPMLLFAITAIAEVNRTPFDLPEAESELVSGYHTEYTGMKFGLFFLGEYGNVYLISLVFAVLFLGGWHSPFGYPDPLMLPGIVWLLGKGLLFVLFMMWVRWTLPRLRVDQLMALSWKLLLPLGFVALAIMAAAIAAGWA